MRHLNDSHKKIGIWHCRIKISRCSFLFCINSQDDCYYVSLAGWSFSMWPCTAPSKSGGLIPLSCIWAGPCLTKTRQQRWFGVASEIGQEAMKVPPGSLRRLALGNIHLPETITLGGPHTGTQLSPTFPLHTPRCSIWEWVSQLPSGAPAV